MGGKMSVKKRFGSLAKNNEGGFAISFAIAISILMLGAAFALDYSRLSATQAQLSDLSDAAALAGANIADGSTDDERNAVVMEMLLGNNMPNKAPIKTQTPTIIFDDVNQEVTVDLTAKVDLMFIGFLNASNLNISSKTVASYKPNIVNPIALAFVLDVSGSMGWNTTDGRRKIDVLKSATVSFFDALESRAPGGAVTTKVRAGMSAYNRELVDVFPMSFGWGGLENRVDRLEANGGTNSTPALTEAYDQIDTDGYRPDNLRQFVIFMTDGDNNRDEWDDESEAICDDMKADGIEIFTVAFAAPTKGQRLLLECASTNTNDDGSSVSIADPTDIDELKAAKSNHYFDAEDAAAFEQAFVFIGELIGEKNVRIVK